MISSITLNIETVIRTLLVNRISSSYEGCDQNVMKKTLK